MIKAKASNGDIILGLSEENVQRMKDNQPIKFPISEIIPGQPGDMIIIHGETEQSMLELFQQNTKVNNVQDNRES